MIPYLILWLALLGGQTQHWVRPYGADSCYVPSTVPNSANDGKTPACILEHVIEIRTKRERKEVDNWGLCTDGFAPDHRINEHLGVCERVTKTLWIDGVKFGTIKEVEEK